MTRRSFHILLVAVVTAATGLSFGVARRVILRRQQQQVLAHCPVLDTSSFVTQAEALRREHRRQRRQLGRLLLDPNGTNEAIQQQAEVVIEANNRLFQFVIEHLLSLGDGVTAAEKQQFFALAGQIMHDGKDHPYTSGPHTLVGQPADANAGCPNCRSKKPVCDCTGLSNQLHLTAEQFDIAAQANPNFAREARELADLVCHSHRELVALLRDPHATADEIRAQTDTFLQARSRLERRTVDYIIAIRPCLSRQQIKQLTGMCSR